VRNLKSYAGILTNSLYWWMSRKKSFIINDEYRIDLIQVNPKANTAEIKITNLQPDRIIKGVKKDV